MAPNLPQGEATAAEARRAIASSGLALSGLAVQRVLALARAELLQFKPVRVVAPVLARDVVALLALRARQRDLGTDVGRLGHGGVPSSLRWGFQRSRIVGARDRMQNARLAGARTACRSGRRQALVSAMLPRSGGRT